MSTEATDAHPDGPASTYRCAMPTRLAVVSLVEWSFAIVRDWAESAGHEIALLVTQPGDDVAPSLRYSSAASRETVVMVVPTVKRCEATLAELDVDLAVVFTFRRVPESVATLPRHGCVNLHPSLLPAYRGVNGYRAIYEGEPRIGATLHYLTPEFDAGPILAQSSVPTPEEVEPVSGWRDCDEPRQTCWRRECLALSPGNQGGNRTPLRRPALPPSVRTKRFCRSRFPRTSFSADSAH